MLFKLLRRKFGNYVDSQGIMIYLNEEFSMIKKEEDKLQKLISDRMKSYFQKKIEKDISTVSDYKSTFGTFNPLTSHLYFKISWDYLKLFISILLILNFS